MELELKGEEEEVGCCHIGFMRRQGELGFFLKYL
jgi:hypothetical protein